MSYQLTVIVGNLGRDPEMRYTPSGQVVTNFSVATTRQYADAAGQIKKETTWFRISVWGKQAENCNQYLRKGSKVLIEGRLNADPATGGPHIFARKDGSPGANYELTASNIKFLSSKKDGSGGEGEEETASQHEPAVEDCEIPF